MCLTTPGQVVRIDASSPDLRMAEVDFGNAVRTVNLVFTPEARVGDFVIVHAGFATRTVAEREAREAIAYLRELVASAVTATTATLAGDPS